MKIQFQQFSLPGRRPGPFGQLLAVLVGAVVLASALILGFFVFVVVFGLLVFAWLAFVLRAWLGSGGKPSAAPHAGKSRKGNIETLEGEFEVVDNTTKSGAAKTHRPDGKP